MTRQTRIIDAGQSADWQYPRSLRCVAMLVAGLLVTGLSACGGKAAPTTTTQPVLTVELVSPRHESWADTLVASGEIAAWQEASIDAEVGGVRLDEVKVNVGDAVHKGQLLARYNEDTLRTDLAQLDAAVAEARANLARAKSDAERGQGLTAIGALPQQTLDLYRTQVDVTSAQLASAQARREAQALRLRYARVVAPDDGVISSRSATVGTVSVIGAELFRLVRDNRLEWRAEVPADSLAHLKAGTTAVLRTLDGTAVSGRLRQLSPMVDTGTRNGIAYVDLPAGNPLAAGMYVTGRFTLGKRDALVVPESAVVLRDGSSYLMMVDAQHRVHALKVDTGRRQQGAIEILGSLDPAAQFVKSGGAFVSDGNLVQIAAATATAP
ncbi:efflux RND transporter periplasmic adaptor subunit [Solimonas terrae]|uniref:Efflux RND transporter periplasmic adaptor subunit n=1 Tax=Solimonas terrae TaxID=1396819 RepID=A0A6M2BQT3_9GAMM|nr:efflux RND transporter periplasmic adaptor subunit [Solimonas terrae]NGY04992.1 efflux RND transporter periplasmic adaptor subunit [Solimonas terrae]